MKHFCYALFLSEQALGKKRRACGGQSSVAFSRGVPSSPASAADPGTASPVPREGSATTMVKTPRIQHLEFVKSASH